MSRSLLSDRKLTIAVFPVTCSERGMNPQRRTSGAESTLSDSQSRHGSLFLTNRKAVAMSMREPAGAVTAHVQLRLFGYISGNFGLMRCPLGVVYVVCRHTFVKRDSVTHAISSLDMSQMSEMCQRLNEMSVIKL